MTTESPNRIRRGSRKMQFLEELYRNAHPDEGPEIDPDKIAAWSLQNGHWQPIPITPREQLRRLISRSMRETHMLDPQNREVRANVPITKEVMTTEGLKRRSTYVPLFQATGKVARTWFALRRKSALNDVNQLDLDFMSWTENNVFGAALEPMDYNFEKDRAEMKEPTTYEEPDEEDDPNY